MPRLLLATNNPGKLREYRGLLAGCGYDLVTPGELGIKADVPETGSTFAANARLKALTLAKASRLLTLADDSGLEVDALGCEPGVRSARYGGKKSDSERIDLLLSRLRDFPTGKRTARFRCVIAIATPQGSARTVSGECRGLIAGASRGSSGFGYDPVFYLPELGQTMAELPPEIKNRISHRARAAARACRLLRQMASREKT